MSNPTTRKRNNSQLTQEMVLLRNFLELWVTKGIRLDEWSGWKLLHPKEACGGGLYQEAHCSVLGPWSQLRNVTIQQTRLAVPLHQPFLSTAQRFLLASCWGSQIHALLQIPRSAPQSLRNSCSPQIFQRTQLSRLNSFTHRQELDFPSCPHIKRAAPGLTWGVTLQLLSK